ncbi:helix-turn-helix domain-containing protein [Hyphomicrobium album]|uniref:helix-turn-helix domain-containing protein n=1 Tax=Hyphomicrobium album TaxID=2665159 RepID=UPI002D21B0FA|nr:helix-turn-helix domain-containing protein [Hyphomicrobium album]
MARQAGVSKGTLYVYFDSKEGLFEAVVEDERGARPSRFFGSTMRITTSRPC